MGRPQPPAPPPTDRSGHRLIALGRDPRQPHRRTVSVLGPLYGDIGLPRHHNAHATPGRIPLAVESPETVSAGRRQFRRTSNNGGKHLKLLLFRRFRVRIPEGAPAAVSVRSTRKDQFRVILQGARRRVRPVAFTWELCPTTRSSGPPVAGPPHRFPSAGRRAGRSSARRPGTYAAPRG